MATNTAGTSARQDPRQVLNTLKRIINYSDADAYTGAPLGTTPGGVGNYLPQSAFVIEVIVEVNTAFNSATTDQLSVGTGTNSTAWNTVAATDVNLTVTGVYRISRGVGRVLTNDADTAVVACYTQGGTTATRGQAIVTLTFDGGFVT